MIVVTAPASSIEAFRAALAGSEDVLVVAGSDRSRQASVALGLAALGHRDADAVVLVHDAARCLTPVVVFERVLAALAAGAAGAIPGVPVVDTIKVVDAGGFITATPLRDSLRAVQTPQGFDRALLTAAHASGAAATDDAALVEALGHDVIVVEGDALGLKITTVDDLARAERLLSDH